MENLGYSEQKDDDSFAKPATSGSRSLPSLFD